MTDSSSTTPYDEDLTLVLVVHGLFIGSLLGFAPAAVVGLIIAFVAQESPGAITGFRSGPSGSASWPGPWPESPCSGELCSPWS